MQANVVRNTNTVEPDDAKEFDLQLLQRLRRRDRASLQDLIERYGTALARAAYLHLGDDHAAEDVAQETLIAAWDRARRAWPETRLRPWLFAILFNQCRKHRRSLWRRLRRERVAGERRLADGLDNTEREEQLEMVREALGQLDERLRSVIILRFEQGFSVAQTAATLHLPEGTVKSQTHAAVRELRTLLRRDP